MKGRRLPQAEDVLNAIGGLGGGGGAVNHPVAPEQSPGKGCEEVWRSEKSVFCYLNLDMTWIIFF